MSEGKHQDPRLSLVREKYFSMRPKPLERWLWAAKAPPSAERVYWYHWDLGYQAGNWLSQVPLRAVARDCGLDVATVTRAYQWLRAHGVLRRVDPGRDERNPFQQATALTEVFVPRDLVARLHAEPSRRRHRSPAPARTEAPAAAPATPPAAPTRIAPRADLAAVFRKLSEGERARFYAAQRDRRSMFTFDADTRLVDAEQGQVLATLALVATARPTATPAERPAIARPSTRLTAIEMLGARRSLARARSVTDGPPLEALLAEVVWSMEEGSLSRFSRPHALAIACKTVREGRWSRPYRMPADWQFRRALPEACVAAGQ